MSNLNEKATRTASRYLEHRGYDILEEGWASPAGTSDVIATDGDVLVFAEVAVTRDSGRGFPRERFDEASRAAREASALAYLAERDVADMMVRFDNICLTAFAEDHALIRHHANALGEALLKHPSPIAASIPDALPEAA